MPARKSRSSGSSLGEVLSLARVRLSPHRAVVNRAALRLGRPASIPRARAAELLAGGTRERGPPFGDRYHCPVPGCHY